MWPTTKLSTHSEIYAIIMLFNASFSFSFFFHPMDGMWATKSIQQSHWITYTKTNVFFLSLGFSLPSTHNAFVLLSFFFQIPLSNLFSTFYFCCCCCYFHSSGLSYFRWHFDSCTPKIDERLNRSRTVYWSQIFYRSQAAQPKTDTWSESSGTSKSNNNNKIALAKKPTKNEFGFAKENVKFSSKVMAQKWAEWNELLYIKITGKKNLC